MIKVRVSDCFRLEVMKVAWSLFQSLREVMMRSNILDDQGWPGRVGHVESQRKRYDWFRSINSMRECIRRLCITILPAVFEVVHIVPLPANVGIRGMCQHCTYLSMWAVLVSRLLTLKFRNGRGHHQPCAGRHKGFSHAGDPGSWC